MDFYDLEVLCQSAPAGGRGQRLVSLVLSGVRGVRGDRRFLWPSGPRGWVVGVVSNMDSLVEFDADDVLSYISQCACCPRIDVVRVANGSDYELAHQQV